MTWLQRWVHRLVTWMTPPSTLPARLECLELNLAERTDRVGRLSHDGQRVLATHLDRLEASSTGYHADLAAHLERLEFSMSATLRAEALAIGELAAHIGRLESLLLSTMPALCEPRVYLPDCGHETTSWFQDVEHGRTWCPACHARHANEEAP